MFCSQCGTAIVPSAKFCGNCGAPTSHPPGPIASQPAETPHQTRPSLGHSSNQQSRGVRKNFLQKLIGGDLGLAKTYWLFGMLPALLLNIIISIVEKAPSVGTEPAPTWLTVAFLFYTGYWAVVAVGCWRAATKYQGSSIWPALAKISLGIGWALLIISFFSFASLYQKQTQLSASRPQPAVEQSRPTAEKPPTSTSTYDREAPDAYIQSNSRAGAPGQTAPASGGTLPPDSPAAIRKARQMNSEAINLIHSGDYANAIILLSEATKISTNDAEIYGNFGLALRAAGLPYLAKENFEKSLSININLAWVLAYYGMTLSELNDPAAIVVFRHYFEVSGHTPDALKYITDRTQATHYSNAAYAEGSRR